MSYDPFARGPLPVGVRTGAIADPERGRELAIEFWYPCREEHAGQDLAAESQDRYRILGGSPQVSQEAVRDGAPGDGRYPLVIFSHGYGGHRRQTTHLCTHLASHGYAVAAVDHAGSALEDVMRLATSLRSAHTLPEPGELLGSAIRDRPADVRLAIDRILGGALGRPAVDPDRIGVSGHSFGGWTTLMAAGSDPRVRAALPLAPAGGASPLPVAPIADALDLDWDREVPTLYLVAEHDSLLPLEGMHELRRRTRGLARMAVLKNADHMHFCDRVEETHEFFRLLAGMAPPAAELGGLGASIRPASEHCPGSHAYAFLRGLGLAHLDAALKQSAAAAELLEGDLVAALAARGVEIEVFP
ncbi:MAG: alpha/beta hydrolase [Myxococcota bacterium]